MLPTRLLAEARDMGRFYGGMLGGDADTAFDRMLQLAAGKPAEAHLNPRRPAAIAVFDGLAVVGVQPDLAEAEADTQAVIAAFRAGFREARAATAEAA